MLKKQRWYILNSVKDGAIQMYFCKGYDYGEKVYLSKTYWNPKKFFFRDN